MVIHTLKYLLWVNKKALSFAFMPEFGKYPIIFYTFKSVLYYWHTKCRLENVPSNEFIICCLYGKKHSEGVQTRGMAL